MDKNILKKIVIEQNEEISKENIVSREIFKHVEEYFNTPFVQILIGLRRSGKSTLLNEIREKNNHNFNYLNFDDYRLLHFKVEDFELLEEIFLELYGEKQYYYFDEIQNVKYWERFIRTLHDRNKKVLLTGSNASMLSSELGTHLTGRSITTEIFPFSFKEFLTFNNVKLLEKDLYKNNKIAIISNLFEEYSKKGGIPDYLKYEKTQFLEEIVENILYKDILSRYNLTNSKSLKELIYYLFSNISKELSYNKLKEKINVKNATTVKEYIEYLENSYLIFTINKFSYSLSKQLQNPKKIYAIDVGIAQKVSFSFSENKGRILENIVFLELRRKHNEIFYHKEKKECDFVIKEKEKIVQAIQVCTQLSDEDTKKREIDGLLEALDIYDLDEGLILNEYEENEEIINGKKIKIIPVWKWILQ